VEEWFSIHYTCEKKENTHPPFPLPEIAVVMKEDARKDSRMQKKAGTNLPNWFDMVDIP
jgi:hypothetical protein